MESRWRDEDAARFPGDLGQRVYTSRLLGAEPALVLHGGGNTSVKTVERNLFGEDEVILRVKGSGWDLVSIEADGFSPCRLEAVRRLATLERLSDVDMVRELRAAMTRPDAPTPSVEAILHAVVPDRFVDHTHADSVLAITNSRDGERRAREIWGDRVIVLPYLMPGFVLARAAAAALAGERRPGTIGMLLAGHGMFSFGAGARESYERMIELVSLAEDHLRAAGAWVVQWQPAPPPAGGLGPATAALRHELSRAAGFPLVVRSARDAQALGFARRPDLARIAREGPVTPDHVIRTKRLALLGRDVEAYAEDYRRYFERNAGRAGRPLRMLDPAPRVVLDPELGMLAAGRTAAEAAIAADIYRHTIDVILRAERLGGWRALSEADLFDVEYWDLEQAKLRRQPAPKPFAGEVALVTGAARGIGRAVVEALLARDAAVVGLDLDPAVAAAFPGPAYLGLVADVTDETALEGALEAAVAAFGGLDLLVANAGIFPPGARIEALGGEIWERAMRVNAGANLALFRRAHPLLRLAPRGGRVVVVGSKNVPAPGPGAAAYSASKAALVQLARVAALEWGRDGIRVNVVHPNQVFDTGIWSDEVLAARAAEYGVSVAEYRRRNLLGVEITSRDVAELVAELLGPAFARTTGAQIPIDGGNERVV